MVLRAIMEQPMPELPEVETIANGVHARVHGQRIAHVWTSGKPQTFKSSEAEIAAALSSSRIESVRRVGKTIVMTLHRDVPKARTRLSRSRPIQPNACAGSVEFLIHLGMTGRLLVCSSKLLLAPHTHAVLTLEDRREIRFVDPRRFGRLSLHTAQPTTSDRQPANFSGPGHEPLTISLDDFIALFHPRRTPIKAALLNQSLLHGIGNIYADESLFCAAIRPTRQAARLTRAELVRLRSSLVKVLRHAIQLGGSSVSDYVDADGARGFFQLQHTVYQRTGQPCLVCNTPIKKIALAGRSTHFCPHCQR
jgi:formamidopyrimidine-DNA glycosylase